MSPPYNNRPCPRHQMQKRTEAGQKAADLPLFRKSHLPVFSLLFALKEIT
jgi:hypothetical protein